MSDFDDPVIGGVLAPALCLRSLSRDDDAYEGKDSIELAVVKLFME